MHYVYEFVSRRSIIHINETISLVQFFIELTVHVPLFLKGSVFPQNTLRSFNIRKTVRIDRWVKGAYNETLKIKNKSSERVELLNSSSSNNINKSTRNRNNKCLNPSVMIVTADAMQEEKESLAQKNSIQRL